MYLSLVFDVVFFNNRAAKEKKLKLWKDYLAAPTIDITEKNLSGKVRTIKLVLA